MLPEIFSWTTSIFCIVAVYYIYFNLTFFWKTLMSWNIQKESFIKYFLLINGFDGLLAKKNQLDANFKLIKNHKQYMIYNNPKAIKIYHSSTS